MNELTTTNPLDGITRIEYHGQPVLTTAQLAEAYETTVNNLQSNFRNNSERFIKSKHYFKLEGDELASFRDCLKNFQTVVPPRTSVLYLWTKKGCARHCKSVNTDKAWAVFEELEDNYFNQPVDNDKPLKSIDGFERGKELVKVLPYMKDPYMQKRLAAKVTNLLMGEEFFAVHDLSTIAQLTLFNG